MARKLANSWARRTGSGTARLATGILAAGLCQWSFSSIVQAQCAFKKGSETVESVRFTKVFKYLTPGVLFPPTSIQTMAGQTKSRYYPRYVAIPNLVYPFDFDSRDLPEDRDDDQRAKMGGSAPSERDDEAAVMQSIVGSFGGCGSPSGKGVLDVRNYQHPDRDNFGESRGNGGGFNPFVSSGRGHQGCDIRNPTGKKGQDVVRAAEGGTVLKVLNNGTVVIKALPASNGGSGTTQFYLHMRRADVLVKNGDEVAAGDPIGIAGSVMGGSDSGTLPHLHFEIRVSSFAVNGQNINKPINVGAGNWGIPLPCYPSLVAGKMRELGQSPNIVGDQLAHDPRYEATLQQFKSGDFGTSDVQPPVLDADLSPEPPAGKSYDSFWIIENTDRPNAVLGFMRNVDGRDTDEFYLLTKRSTMFKRAGQPQEPQERVFKGKMETVPDPAGGQPRARYKGKLAVLDPSDDASRRCPDVEVDASGPVLDQPYRLELTADIPLREPYPSCKPTGTRTDIFPIVFYGNLKPGDPTTGTPPQIVDKERKSIVEVTRNWVAVTRKKGETWMLEAVDPADPAYPYTFFQTWPGLRKDGHKFDKYGQVVPAFETDEAGVGLWWYWITRRKKFGPEGQPTFRELARGIAGAGANDATVANYLRNYLPLARRYFKNGVPGPETKIALSDPEQRFALAWTMFHHEAGREPIIDRATFERGLRLGRDVIGKSFKRLCEYDAEPCAAAPTPPTPVPDQSADGGGAVPPTPPAPSPSPVTDPSDLQKLVYQLEDENESLREENTRLLSSLTARDTQIRQLQEESLSLIDQNQRLRAALQSSASWSTEPSHQGKPQSSSSASRVMRYRSSRPGYCSASDGWLLCSPPRPRSQRRHFLF